MVASEEQKRMSDGEKRLNRVKKLLEPHQIEVFPRILEILNNNYAYLDVSDAGLGKTTMTGMVALALGFKHVGFITNKSGINKSRELAQNAGLNPVFVISYESLHGRGENCNHDLLERNGKEFKPSKTLIRYAEAGMLLCIDEPQKAKSEGTLNQKSCIAVVSAIIGTKSRIALTSASPLAEEYNIITIPRLSGVITEEKLVEYDPKSYSYKRRGFAELESYCMAIDEKKTRKIIPNVVNDKNVINVSDRLIIDVLIPEISIKMRNNKKCKNTIQNRAYSISEEDSEILEAASYRMSLARSACAAKGMHKGMTRVSAEYDGLSENIKLSIIAREIVTIKEKCPNAKIIIFVWRRESANALKRLLSKFDKQIAVLNGTVVKMVEREAIRSKFMEDNDEMEIVIGNPVVMGAGGDWDDLTGNRPRFTFIIPSARFIETFQSAFRASRITSKSDTYTIIVYIKNIKAEQRMFERCVKRNETLGKIRAEMTDFPSELIDDDECKFSP